MHLDQGKTRSGNSKTSSTFELESITILAGRVFDVFTLQFLVRRTASDPPIDTQNSGFHHQHDQAITVDPESGLICSVRPLGELGVPLDAVENAVRSGDPRVVDLRKATVLPGFVDVHVHCKC